VLAAAEPGALSSTQKTYDDESKVTDAAADDVLAAQLRKLSLLTAATPAVDVVAELEKDEIWRWP